MCSLLPAALDVSSRWFVVMAGVLALTGIGGLIGGLVHRLRARRMARVVLLLSGIAAARGAELAAQRRALAVEGRVRCKRPLLAPATGTPCLYYQLEIKGSWTEGGARHTRTYLDRRASARFFVDDGSGPLGIAADRGGDFEGLVQTFQGTRREGYRADLDGLIPQGEPMMFGSYAFVSPRPRKPEVFTCTERVLRPVAQLYASGILGADRRLQAPRRRALILTTRLRAERLDRAARSARRLLLGGGATAGFGMMLGLLALVV